MFIWNHTTRGHHYQLKTFLLLPFVHQELQIFNKHYGAKNSKTGIWSACLRNVSSEQTRVYARNSRFMFTLATFPLSIIKVKPGWPKDTVNWQWRWNTVIAAIVRGRRLLLNKLFPLDKIKYAAIIWTAVQMAAVSYRPQASKNLNALLKL